MDGYLLYYCVIINELIIKGCLGILKGFVLFNYSIWIILFNEDLVDSYNIYWYMVGFCLISGFK